MTFLLFALYGYMAGLLLGAGTIWWMNKESE